VMLHAVTTTEFHVVILPHTDWIKSSGHSFLCCAARLFLRAFSTLITEMHVPSLPMSPGASKLVLILL